MSDLMVRGDGLLAAEVDPQARALANSRTKLALSQLRGDHERQAVIILFLYDTGLIQAGNPIVSLHDADLRHIFLDNESLAGVDLSSTLLGGTDLDGADLSGADLSHAALNCVGAETSDFACVSMNATILRGADLSEADLVGADLTCADLSGATVAEEQLRLVANLRFAIMPDGSPYAGQFELPGDLEEARQLGIDTGDDQAMREFYARPAKACPSYAP